MLQWQSISSFTLPGNTLGFCNFKRAVVPTLGWKESAPVRFHKNATAMEFRQPTKN